MARARVPRSTARQTAEHRRLVALQAATAALSGAVTPAEVAAVVLDHGLALLGARAGSVSALAAGGALERLDARGLDGDLIAALHAASAATPGPAADATRAGKGIWLESPSAIEARYPPFAAVARRGGFGALAALALLVRGRPVGALAFWFAAPHRFGAADRSFAIALADACALALERARLFESERRLRAAAEETAAAIQELDPFRVLVDQVTDYAIFMLDPHGFVRTWNRGAERIKGWRAAEIVGQHFSRFYPEADARAGKPARALAAAAASGRFEEEGLRVRKDGSTFVADVVITALRDGRGELRGFAKVTRDVTERLRAERERLRLAQVEEGRRARDQFLAIAAHEFRTPITTLDLYTQALLRGLERGEDAPISEAAPRLRIIHRQSVRLAHLVQAMLDVVQITAGRLALHPEPVDLAAVVREAMERWREALGRAGCPLELRVDRSIAGQWDRARLEEVIDQLVSNAVKFGAGHPVEVCVEARDGEAHLAVSDHGIGMSEEDQRRIFQRFERAVPLAHYGGFGLGLWLVRNIVEAHGGDIQVWSAPGKGSRFDVTLPRM